MPSESSQNICQQTNNTQKLHRMWQNYALPYRSHIFGAVPLAILAGLGNTAQAYLFQPAIDKVIIEGDSFYLWVVPVIFLVIGLLRGIAVYLQSVMIAYAAEKIVVGLQKDIFAKLLRLDIAFFHEFGESPQVGRFLTDVRFIREGTIKVFTSLPKEFVSAVGMLALMLYHSPLLSLVVLMAVPVFMLPVFVVGKKMRRISSRTQEEAGRLTSVLDQALSVLRQIKLAGRYKNECDRADHIFQKMQRLMVKMVSYEQILTPLNEVIRAICFGITIVLGGYLVQQGEMTVGALTSFLVALIGLFVPIRVIMRINGAFQAALAGMDRTFGLLDRSEKISDIPNALDLKITKGEIIFENVYFAYNEKKEILNNLNLSIEGGARTALVGASGAGKSTILSLVPRFYDPNRGRVMIDGQDITQVRQSSLHQSIAYISQETELFNFSLFENVRYTRAEARMDEVLEVLDQVGLRDFVEQLPQGVHTEIGENGVRLSGGQRQRIAFARALLSRARIILMDEATSALDSESEMHVQRAMQYFPKGASVIVVAHRLSTIKDADCICVLDQGKLLEQGTHDQLIKQKGAYANYYYRQFDRVDE